MGKYFLMSMRFNKNTAEDFGLVQTENDLAINPKDNTVWKKRPLYDFGWGEENGYVLNVEISFDDLIDLVLNGDKEDSYGAASVVLKEHSDIFLDYCENMFSENNKEEINKIIEVFNLIKPINRSTTINKPIDTINNDYNRWNKISENSKAYLQNKKRKFLWFK